jgi:predicted deacetylase
MSDRSGEAPVEIWWRDDDAQAWTPELERLCALRRTFGLPLAVAVIPAHADPAMLRRLSAEPKTEILVHGWSHTDKAGGERRKMELTGGLDLGETLARLSAGLASLRRLAPATLPVLVPPWNRIAPDVLAALPSLGFAGVSAWREGLQATQGLTIANATVDLIDWRGGGQMKSAACLHAEIASQRANAGAKGVRIGLLSHHLRMNSAGFANLEELLRTLSSCATVRWPAIRDIFGLGHV